MVNDKDQERMIIMDQDKDQEIIIRNTVLNLHHRTATETHKNLKLKSKD